MNIPKKTGFIAFVLLLAGCVGMPQAKPKPSPETSIPLTRLLEVIKRATEEAQGAIMASKLPPLASVEVSVQTTLDKSGRMEAELLVLSAGTKHEQSTTQTVGITLGRPEAKKLGIQPFGKDLDGNLYGELVEAIIAAGKAADAAHKAGIPELELNAVTASVGFDITRTAEGGLKLELGSLSIGPSMSTSTTAAHKVELSYKK